MPVPEKFLFPHLLSGFQAFSFFNNFQQTARHEFQRILLYLLQSLTSFFFD